MNDEHLVYIVTNSANDILAVYDDSNDAKDWIDRQQEWLKGDLFIKAFLTNYREAKEQWLESEKLSGSTLTRGEPTREFLLVLMVDIWLLFLTVRTLRQLLSRKHQQIQTQKM